MSHRNVGRWGAIALTGVIVAAVLAVAALATPGGLSAGALDTTFGQGGVVTVQANPECAHGCPPKPEVFGDKGSSAKALALAPDGAIVLAGGDFGRQSPDASLEWLVRLHANGALDASFGSGGFAEGAPGLEMERVFVGAGGDVFALVKGENGLGLALERFTAAGALDRSLGTKGVSWLVAPRERVEEAVDARGRIVVLHEPPSPGPIALSRFLPSGAPDPAFGRDGLAHVRALAKAQPVGFATGRDGDVVVLGETSHHPDRFSMARLTGAGAFDRSFGERGVVRVPPALFNGEDVEDVEASMLAVGPRGQILLVHDERLIESRTRHRPRNDRNELTLARYTSRGELDRSFGVRGVSRTVRTIYPGDSGFKPQAIVFGAGGGAMVVGNQGWHGIDTGTEGWSLMRYTPHGRDCSFDEEGFVKGVEPPRGEARAVAVERDGRIVIAGKAGSAFMVARYIGGGRGRTCPGEGHGVR